MREMDIPDFNPSGRARRSLLRSLQVGFAVAMVGFALSCLIDFRAPNALTDIPSNYASGDEKLEDIVEMSLLFYRVSIIAPIAEELVFRAGMLGGLIWLFSWICGKFFVLDRMSPSERFWRLELLSFWVPAVLVSGFFVVLHETANPINIMIRMIGAMAMAYFFYKEGLMATLFAHAFHNGIIGVFVCGAELLGGDFGVFFIFMFILWVLLLTAGTVRSLILQHPDRRAGRIAPYALNSWLALLFLCLLALGLVSGSRNPTIGLGMAGLVVFIIADRLQLVSKDEPDAAES